MAPTSDSPEDVDETEDKTEKTKSKHKKQEAVQAEQYDQAARFHQKIQQLEAQLALVETSEDAGASGTGGDEDAEDEEPQRKPVQRRSLLSAPNPFRTVELLEQSGYSRPQACGLLFLLYVMVFALEMVLLYVGWRLIGLGGESADEGFNEDMMEEL
ncbi:unnamed protein product [Effrenium voratum]|nr:unnamed protein product [Effrenium voratum]CAJ1455156.1 unnamed protein product [Effrenium voratum]